MFVRHWVALWLAGTSGLEPLAALGLVCNIVQLVEVGLKTATLCKNAYRTGEPDPELSVYAQNLAVTASSLSQSLETDLLVGIFKSLDVSRIQANDLQEKFRYLLQATSTSERNLRDLVQAQLALVNAQLSDRIDKAESSTKAHITSELDSHESRIISHANKGRDSFLTETEVREANRRENEAYEGLLRSFSYPDMNKRRNEIHSSHARTFHWIFEGGSLDVSHPKPRLDSTSGTDAEELVCSAFVRWLKLPEGRYWISGRPGTGKTKPLCLFIDGLDELVDDDGVCTLIEFLNTLQMSSPLVKIYLKMQDLTQLDIQRYVMATLGNAVTLARPSIFVEHLVMDITNKAEGVFLWAVLVTRSVARGLSNGDSEEDIQQRLIKTPKKLHELYFDMWTRLGEDSDLYRESTALILKIALFLWQALRSEKFSYKLPTLSAIHFCFRNDAGFKLRFVVHVSGLFEVIRNGPYGSPTEEQMADESFPHLPKYDKLQVQPIHRTAFDFLIETKGGQNILEYDKSSREELFVRVFRSCLLRESRWPEVYYVDNPTG
ncbi:NACHT domain protein [Fusarium sp. NRRL 52700]|nr:NACHT domain protein [Fusarium sp. NRRL 52700]